MILLEAGRRAEGRVISTCTTCIQSQVSIPTLLSVATDDSPCVSSPSAKSDEQAADVQGSVKAWDPFVVVVLQCSSSALTAPRSAADEEMWESDRAPCDVVSSLCTM